MPADLLRRRISVPPLPDRLIPRERLEARIAELVDRHRLVIVSASAGAGKTTAVVRATERISRAVAWLTIDAADQAAGRLVTYLEGALAVSAPEAAQAAQSAMAHGASHAEAAGLLVQAVDDRELVLVLDEVERIQSTALAWDVVEATIRYAPDRLRLVMISRRSVTLPHRSIDADQVAWVLESDLAFDIEEVRQVLDLTGGPTAAESVMSSTSGWVTGVVFDARATAPGADGSGATDPLHGYLATQILAELDDADESFLILTSPLDEVTVERAIALGFADARKRLHALREVRLPVTWVDGGQAMRCHSRFREFLISQLQLRDPGEISCLYTLLGRLLRNEGLAEEAVEALLRAGALSDAAELAATVLPRLVDRLDVDVAERWLRQLRPVHRPPVQLIETELTLAAATEDFSRIIEIGGQLAAQQQLQEIVSASPRAGALIAWAYAHNGQLARVHGILRDAPTSPETRAIRYMLDLIDPPSGPTEYIPSFSGGPLDALIIRDHYIYGRLDRVLDDARSPWIDAVVSPWRIAALRALGQVSRANELLDEAHRTGIASLGLTAIVGPETRLDARRVDEAWELAEHGLPAARSKGSALFAALNRCVAAKVALRGLGDPERAMGILGALASEPIVDYRYVDEVIRTWRGLGALQLGRDAQAFADLEVVVASMLRGDRILELSTAAVYLSEARWRSGDETGADAAADLAFETARRQGSNHSLLQALADFPAVLSRRLDAEAFADSPWHALGRSLHASSGAYTPTASTSVAHLQDLGKPSLIVDGARAQVRINKALELLSFLLIAPDHRASRDELLDALFHERTDTASRSYLRTAIHWMKLALPESVGVEATHEFVRFEHPELIRADSLDALQLLREASHAQGPGSLRAARAAFALIRQGEFLAGLDSAWVARRRREIEQRAADARYAAAETGYALGQLDDALELANTILAYDRFREVAWRLKMRILGALGDDDAVLAAYQACRAALSQIGAEPAPATQSLLTALRR